MYKRPRPPKGSAALSPALASNATQAASLGWQKWNLPTVETESNDADFTLGLTESIELDPDVLEELEAEQQAQELESLRQEAHAEGYTLGVTLGVEEGKKDGHESGFAAGYEEGLAKAQEQAQALLAEKLAVIDAMVNQSQMEFSRLQEDVGQSLVHLGVCVAEHVLGHAIKRPAPSALAMVKEVLRHNEEDGKTLTIWLNPQDLKLIEEDIHQIPTLCQLRLLADASIDRGGIKVKTPHAEVDATLQTRWAAALASIGYKPASSET